MEEKKRLRINGTFRWTERQTKDLLNIIMENVKANPEQFKKPTAQKFYEHITKNASTLNSIKWDVMRTKMRHLKTSFSSALKWKGQTGAGLLESGDVKSVEDYIKKMCPFYDDLYAIFGHRVNVQPPAIYQSTMPVSLLDTFEVDALMENDGETFSTSLPESPLASPTVVLPSTSESVASPSALSIATSACTQNTTTPKRNLKRPQNSNPFALLFEIQSKKLELESQKLEFEKEKEQNKFMLQKLQLEKEERIEMEKIRLEHERLSSVDTSNKKMLVEELLAGT
ncbi:uncharacterized protein LOC126759322 [Bactrocera neohumeralis]|uniref:uncharacterized protein LOC126759322 n=1 Tax=Bactrocera neohumeralis TaxID=98809 RepID=UPI0021650023|nr:uncharacterized protein LOC126759322 [Bactrocera neohumeralis]